MLTSILCIFTVVLAHCLGLTTETPRIHQSCPVSHPCNCRWDNPKVDKDSQRNTIDCSKASLKINNLPPMRDSNISFYKVDLSFNLIEELPDDYLSDMYGIQFIDMSDNKLKSLPSSVTKYSKLKWLRMSHNYLEQIEPNTFQDMHSLLMLNLTFNRLTQIEDNTFIGLDRLENLFLDKNKISTISSNAFSEMSRLQKIDLTDNKLVIIPDDIFNGLTSLKYLDLDSNKLTELPNYAFKDLKRLKDLKLQNNKLKTLHPDSLAGLFKVHSLQLQDNLIENLPNGIFRDLFSIRYADFHNNHLNNFTKSMFQNTKSAAELMFLMLARTGVQTFEDDLFSQFPRLRVLDLTELPLKEMPILRFSPGLKTLSIAMTDIRTLYPCDLEGLDQLRKIYWSPAPIACDCNLKWLRLWFDQQIDQTTYTDQIGGPWKCETPLKLKGSQFHLLPEDSFECDSGEKPIECPYEFDAISGKIKRGNTREQQEYTLDVSANFDGETLTVEWNKDTLLVAHDVIKRFQVLLHFEGHYMATTFPVPKDQYSLTVTNVLSPDVKKFNVCVEVIGNFNDVITANCVYFTATEKGSTLNSSTKIVIAVAVPLILVAGAVIIFIVYQTRFRSPASGSRVRGIPNVMYDRYKDDQLHSQSTFASEISISGLPSQDVSPGSNRIKISTKNDEENSYANEVFMGT